MTDTYQAIYDAVRSKISGGDVGHAVSEVARNAFDISWAVAQVKEEMLCAAYEQQRPSVLFRPTVSPDGDMWVALYGPNLQEGVSGVGKTAAEAMADFDRAWNKDLTPAAEINAKKVQEFQP